MFKVLAIGVEKESQRDRPKNAGILNQNIDRPNQRHGLSGDGMNRVLVSDVGNDAVGFASSALDFGYSLVQLFLPSGHQDDTSSLRCQSLCQRSSQTSAAAGYENGSTPGFHVFFLLPNQDSSLCSLVIRIANVLAEGYFLGMATIASNLASNIRQLREARGLTQDQMSRIAEVPRPTWAN